MKTKQKVLIFIDWFYPAYKAGGPLKSVFNLVQALKKEFDFSIVTSNSDLDGERLEVEPNEWTNYEGIDVIYLTKEKQRRKVYRAILEEKRADVVYYNSLFSKNFTLKPYRALKKYDATQIIAPRGMLGSGALAIKPLKKKAFIKVSKQLFFSSKKTVWHATSAQEAEEIRKAYGQQATIKVAQNLSSIKVDRHSFKKEKGELKLVFLSRLAEKKNLLFALKLMQELKEEKGLSLDIYGPIEEESYWKKCKGIIEQDERIRYMGVVKPQDIAATLQQYHFYILPTLHENYGHSIVEALVAGVPIIISKQTPWRNLQAAGVGADLSLKAPDDWQAYLRKASELNQDSYDQMVEECYRYVEKKIFNPSSLEKAKSLFEI